MHPVERYLADLRSVRTAGGVPETSGYPCLKALLDEVGAAFKPKVVCVLHPGNTGAGIVDAGLFEKSQVNSKKGEVRRGQLPLRGVIEIKSVAEAVAHTIGTEQITRYVAHYGQVLVTNYREFALLVRTPEGSRKVDGFALADSADAFWALADHPRKAADEHGVRFLEFLRRALHTSVTLTNPKDVAWFLASYAREALEHIGSNSLPGLDNVRHAFEEALGVTFTGEKGDHFFRSSLVQTLFYGVFSAWVLWCREQGTATRTSFDWRDSAWTLRVPMIRALFEQVATPTALGQLGLKSYLDRTGDVLNRVDHDAFFATFQLGEAVQYFYEPFLEAFDPELRKELGVWYTPKEIVQYQVARVDWILRTELRIQKGLADPSVYVLDPCCGTGAYLVEVIRRIERTMHDEGDALMASDLRRAARERIFGFELLPASFVIAHLQLGLLMLELGAPFSENGDRAGVYLTNALTGWGADHDRPHLPFPELEQERDKAEDVKRAKPILVILGNPPYNGYAGITESEEERQLTTAYRATKRAPAPQGQGLNDLYVRFFRMAERKIVDGTGQGIVSFISNYSWLDGLSFTGMRERLLDAFDMIEIASLNGDRYRTGKLTPDGRPDPSVFSTESNREGIQVGTAITTAVLWPGEHMPEAIVRFRELWGQNKLAQLASLAAEPSGSEEGTVLSPVAQLGFVLRKIEPTVNYAEWPRLTDLFAVAYPGVQTKRDALVISIDKADVISRMRFYFDPRNSDEELALRHPEALATNNRAFDLRETRRKLLSRGFLPEFITRMCYRPFDFRWVYWEPDEDLLGRKSPELYRQLAVPNTFLEARQYQAKEFDRGYCTSCLPDHFGSGFSTFFPAMLVPPIEGQPSYVADPQAAALNLSAETNRYAGRSSLNRDGMFFHAASILQSEKYRRANNGPLRLDWPRIPMPATQQCLDASAVLGRRVAQLLDPMHENAETIRDELHNTWVGIGRLASADDVPLDAERGDLAVTAGWGSRGKGGVTMPGRGKVTERPDGALDIWLNDRAYWANVPRDVWNHTMGGYQVIKKWLSYREKPLLGRDLTVDEARYVSEMVRRIAAILALAPELDENYERVKEDAFDWSSVS